MTNYYKILRISRCATPVDIKRAYLTLVKQWHPDRNPENPEVATRVLKDINSAYKVLSDKNLRSEYDIKLTLDRTKELQRHQAHSPCQPGTSSRTNSNPAACMQKYPASF